MQKKIEKSPFKNIKLMVERTLLELEVEVAKHIKAPGSNAKYGQELIDEIRILKSIIHFDNAIIDVFKKCNSKLSKGPIKKIVEKFLSEVKPFENVTPAIPLPNSIILNVASLLTAREIATLNSTCRLYYANTSPKFSRFHGVFFARYEPNQSRDFLKAIGTNGTIKITAVGYLMNQKNQIAYKVIGFENGTLEIHDFARDSLLLTKKHKTDSSAVVSFLQLENTTNWASQTQQGTIAVWSLSGQLITSYQKMHADDVLTLSPSGDIISIPKDKKTVLVNDKVDPHQFDFQPVDVVMSSLGHRLVLRASQELEFTFGRNNIAPVCGLNSAHAVCSRGSVYLARDEQFGGVDLHRENTIQYYKQSRLGCVLTNGNFVIIKRDPDCFYTLSRQLFIVDAKSGKVKPVCDSIFSERSHLYCSSLFTVLALPLNHFAVITSKEFRFDDDPKPLPFIVKVYKGNQCIKNFEVDINEGRKDKLLHPKKVTALANGDLVVFTVEGPVFLLNISKSHQSAPVFHPSEERKGPTHN